MTTTPVARPEAAPARRRLPRLPPRTIGLVASVIVLVVVVLPEIAVRLAHGGKVMPGVEVAGVDVGGATEGSLRQTLAPLLAARTPITLTANGRTITVRPRAAGYRADLDATVDRVMAARRGALHLAALGLITTKHVDVVDRVDEARLARTATRVAVRLDIRSVPGAIEIDPDTLLVTTVPAQAGSEVDRRSLPGRLRRAFSTARAPLAVPVHRAAVPDADEIAAVARDARAYLETSLTLTGAGQPVDLDPSTLVPVLALVPTNGGRDAALGAQPRALAALVRDVAGRRDRPARDARLLAPAEPATTLDAMGDVEWTARRVDLSVRPSRDGVAIRQPALREAVEDAIRAGRHVVPVPVATTRPRVQTSALRGVDLLLGTFTTYYEPGQPRVTNIRQIAADVDDTVVRPGRRFSLNGVVGQRTVAGGYVEAPYIEEGRLVPSVGGGVSQFTTTLYNAAYFAGLKIETHRPHSLYISRYPAGREATLNFPDIDLAWTNDTDVPVVIRATTTATSVTVALYGGGGRRTVLAQTGARVPVEGRDFSITVTRVVRYADGREVRQPYTTTYDLSAEAKAALEAAKAAEEAAASATPTPDGSDTPSATATPVPTASPVPTAPPDTSGGATAPTG